MKEGLDYDEDFIDPAIVAQAIISVLGGRKLAFSHDHIYHLCHTHRWYCEKAMRREDVAAEYRRIDQETAAFDISNFLPRKSQS